MILAGEEIANANEESVRKVLTRALSEQYSETSIEDYLQAPLDARTVILDDFDQCRLNRAGKCRVLALVRRYFGQVIAFAHETFMIEEIADRRDPTEDVLVDFAMWRLKEFGHFLRGVLIERWFSLGLDDVADDRELIGQIADAEKLINTIRGRNLIPSYPIVLLTILQTLESNVDLSTISGSYGQRYEFLIASRLRVSGKKIPRDAVLTLVSTLAYAAFCDRRRFITEDQLRDAAAAYSKDYKLEVQFDDIVKTLTGSLILERHAGAFRFKYPYVYFYFVAKYFAQYLDDPGRILRLRAQMTDIAAKVHVTEYANVVIFLVYLTQDKDLIRKMIEHAKGICADHEPCDLDRDASFISRASVQPLRFPEPSQDYRNNRREEQRALDLSEPLANEDDEYEGEIDQSEASRTADDADQNRLHRLNPALKALQVLGQILRNFTGSLTGEMKKEIAQECYYLGLRSMQAVLTVIRNRTDDIVELLADVLLKTGRYADRSEAEMKIEAERFVFYLCQRFAYGAVFDECHLQWDRFI